MRRLRGYTFEKLRTGRRHVGVIAHEVAAVLPEAIHTDEQGLMSVADMGRGAPPERDQGARRENREARGVTLPASGPISLSMIRGEFGGSAPDSLSAYDRGGRA